MQKTFNKKQKAFIIFSFAIFLLIILIVLLTITIYIDSTIYKKEIDNSIIYEEKGQITHQVCLKENDYINEKCSFENRSFITNLIDYINLKIDYQFSASSFLNYSYNYTVLVNSLAVEKGESSKILYTKEETLKESAYNGTSSLIIIDDTIKLDYQKYNNIITSFKKNYVVALDSKLDVKVIINVLGESKEINETLSNTYTLNYTIPLAELTVNINDENTKINNESALIQYKDKTDIYEKYHMLALILYIIDFLYLLTIILLIIIFIPRRQEYNKKIHKILKNYDDIIVKVKKMPDLKKLNIIEVNNFEELLNAQTSLNKPIIYFETSHKDSSSFIITNDSYAYLYVINTYEAVKHDK